MHHTNNQMQQHTKLASSGKIITLSFAWQHQSSNSANPAFTYSPLLNVQHSRRKRRLEKNIA